MLCKDASHTIPVPLLIDNRGLITLPIAFSSRKKPLPELSLWSNNPWFSIPWVSRADLWTKNPKAKKKKKKSHGQDMANSLLESIEKGFLICLGPLNSENLVPPKFLYTLEGLNMTRFFWFQMTETQFESAWLKEGEVLVHITVVRARYTARPRNKAKSFDFYFFLCHFLCVSFILSDPW